MKKLAYSLLGNSQKLDGGAMFGNAPKALWERWMPADERNRIDLACRCLLIRESKRLILFETGIGSFFSAKYKDRYGVVEKNHVLLDSLKKLGLKDSDIDIVVLSHLHFDHAGGLLSAYRENEELRLLFPNAKIIVGQRAWERANAPHLRDNASFIPELQTLLKESNRLEIVNGSYSSTLGDDYRFHLSDGHTPGLLMTEIRGEKGLILFPSDLIPGRAWVHRSITMGYDRYPEQLINEKIQLLKYIHDRDGFIFFTHDPVHAMARLSPGKEGKFGTIHPQEALYNHPV